MLYWRDMVACERLLPTDFAPETPPPEPRGKSAATQVNDPPLRTRSTQNGASALKLAEHVTHERHDFSIGSSDDACAKVGMVL